MSAIASALVAADRKRRLDGAGELAKRGSLHEPQHLDELACA